MWIFFPLVVVTQFIIKTNVMLLTERNNKQIKLIGYNTVMFFSAAQ